MIIKNAYAKINLGLRILRKREDGFHDLETIFHHVNIRDVLTFEENKSVTFNSTHPELSHAQQNLCVRAAILFKQHFGVANGVTISLEKNIPIGAGLGGGSTDAAITLLAMNELWNRNYSVEELLPLATTLGSDVSYFLRNDSAYATGRGEHLSYFKLDIPFWIVVVYPNVHVSTAWAYSQLKVKSVKLKMLSDVILNGFSFNERKEGSSFSNFVNDFEEIVFREYPIVGEIKSKLIEAGAEFALMSGSGSSVFGMFANEVQARQLMDEMKLKFQVFLTPPNFHPGN